MGATDFMHYVDRTSGVNSPAKAFKHAVEEAAWEHGHGGYTGTIAEKGSWVSFGIVATFKEAQQMVRQAFDENDERIDDKWGPAGCIQVGDEGYLFFGWAST